MSIIHISGNETSDSIEFLKPGINEIRLRAETLASGFEALLQRADIGTSGWLDVYLDYNNTAKFNYNIREYTATGNAKYRVVVTGYSGSSNVTFSGYEIIVQSELTESGLDDVREEFFSDPASNQGQLNISDETGSIYTFWNYGWLR